MALGVVSDLGRHGGRGRRPDRVFQEGKLDVNTDKKDTEALSEKKPDTRSPSESATAGGYRAMPVWVVLVALAAVGGAALLTGRWTSHARPAIAETRSWTAMGTIVSVSLCETDRGRQEALFEQVVRRVGRIEEILSAHMPDSELSRLNRLPLGQNMRVSCELWDAVNAGKEWNGKTRGAFDITAGPLIQLWKTAGKVQKAPNETEIAAVLNKMGVDKLVLDKNARTVMKTAGVSIDLGGLGKGFAADDIAHLLKERGAASALVAMSGDIRALGRRPDGRPWRVGIQDPRHPDELGPIVTVVEVSDMAVSTSGNYRRFVEIDGKHYSHIVDPRTGRTAQNVPSVSVIGPDALTTDILGTALSVLGVDDGLKRVESMPGIEALFMEVDDSDELVLTRSSGFARYEACAGVNGKVEK